EDIGDAARPGHIPLGRALNGLPSRQHHDVAEDSDLEISEFRIRPLHVARHRLSDLLRLVQDRAVRVRVEVVVRQESLQRRAILLELGIRDGLFEFDDVLLHQTARLSRGPTGERQAQQRDYEGAYHWYPLGDRWRDTSSVHGVLAARHRSHEKPESVLAIFEAGRLTFVVPQTNNDQLVRWNDQCILPSDTGHVVGALGHGERRVSIYPEEPTVD